MAKSTLTKEPSNTRIVSPYQRIKDAIRDNVFPPGYALVESAVAEWCGVSRTPIREALTRLEHDGLVARTDRGIVVRERTPEEILDIYETRISLEGTAARLAAERHSPLDRRRIERVMMLVENMNETLHEHADRNRDFHRAIWQASHNESLIDLLERLNMHLLRYPQSTLTAPGRWGESLGEHRSLVDAIFARDDLQAKLRAEQHFTRARDIRLAQWEETID